VTFADRLRSPDAAVRTAAIRELAALAAAVPEELEALAECLGHARKAVQRPAAETFAALDAAGVDVGPILERSLESADPRRRWGAAFALSLLGEPPARTLPVLLEALGVDDGDVRWAAASIVLRMHHRADLVAAMTGLLTRGSATQRKMALYCLRQLDVRSASVEGAVASALGDTAWDVRLAAISVLPHVALDRAAAATRLVAELSAPDARFRRAAAAALGTLGHRAEPVVAALRVAAADADTSLRKAAEGALGRLAAERA
jgi:HEAT repeat protein